MRLLVVTQAIDRENPALGFFHQWLTAFAPRFERLEVICLEEGIHALPSNVRVHTLGKEKGGGSRIRYTGRFYTILRELEGSYDAVFVHMNPEYVVLAGLWWRLTGKPIGLWYNHTNGSVWLKLAAPLATVIFHTSRYAYPGRYKHARLMPAGIDTKLFTPLAAWRDPLSIYFQGRIAPAKRVHVLLAALERLRRSLPATVTLVGPEDVAYGASLREEFQALLSAGAVHFSGPVPNEETPALYSAHAVAVNLTADGNFDKTVLEALATETPVIVGSRAFEGLVTDEQIVLAEDADMLAAALLRMLSLPLGQREKLGRAGRVSVEGHHSLTALANALAHVYGA